MNFEALKVGELARRTGLTVRTLHHYDEIGLLRPSLHTDSGHRLYTGRDVARLQQVLSLRAARLFARGSSPVPGPARFLAARGDRHADRAAARADRAPDQAVRAARS